MGLVREAMISIDEAQYIDPKGVEEHLHFNIEGVANSRGEAKIYAIFDSTNDIYLAETPLEPARTTKSLNIGLGNSITSATFDRSRAILLITTSNTDKPTIEVPLDQLVPETKNGIVLTADPQQHQEPSSGLRGGGTAQSLGGFGLPPRESRKVEFGSKGEGGIGEVGKPEHPGKINMELVGAVIEINIAQIEYCRDMGKNQFEAETHTASDLKGRVEVEFVINEDGSVSNPRVAFSNLRSESNPDAGAAAAKLTTDLMLGRIGHFHFPAPTGGSVKVTYPFIFAVE